MLLAIYGGAFDPVHDGHLAVARTASEVLDADIALIPTGDPRHREPAHATATQRLAMLELAIAKDARLRIDQRELLRDRASYTVDTLEEIRAEIGPNAALAMIVGEDAFTGLPGWHRWTELFELAHLVIASRTQPSQMSEALAMQLDGRVVERPLALHNTPAGHVFRLSRALYPQSSSVVRARCAAGQSLRGWVPDAVAAYIASQGLYRDS